jgi:hypothetical protein
MFFKWMTTESKLLPLYFLEVTNTLPDKKKFLEIDISGHHPHCILSNQLYLVFFVDFYLFHTGHNQITVGIICSLLIGQMCLRMSSKVPEQMRPKLNEVVWGRLVVTNWSVIRNICQCASVG